MPKLNQVIASEKTTKARIYSEVTELHHLTEKPDLFNGFSKTYRKISEEGEDLPSERKKVTMMAESALLQLQTLLSQFFDVVATKDYANCHAFGDVMIGDKVLLSQVPVQFLIFLEKQLVDVRKFVDVLPVLDESEDWKYEDATGLHRTEPISTHRTKKVQKAIVLYDATAEHPAQTQLINEDITVGYWDNVKQSGAMTKKRKQDILNRIEILIREVKFAREQANSVDAPIQSVGEKVFSYLLG